MFPTFALLALSICAVWIKTFPIGHTSVAPWVVLFGAAVSSGLIYGILDWTALIPLALLGAFCLCAAREMRPPARAVYTTIAALFAAALALHIAPGFNNPVVVRDVYVSHGAPSFTQYANFDKAAAGLLLLALLSRRCTSIPQWRAIAAPTLLAIGATGLVVMSCAVLTGYVAFDPKLPPITARFLIINLLFTCVAEEALFRGVLQERLIQAWPTSAAAVIALSALLFGGAHYAGGALNMALATIAGLGYALSYHATRRIESSILTHFGVNALHFIGFTYPRLAA